MSFVQRRVWLPGAVALVFLLTGCIKLDMALTVHPDDTVSGTIVLGINKQLLAAAGGSAKDLFKGNGVVASNAPGVSTAPYEDDTYSGQQVTLDNVPLSDLNADAANGGLSIQRVGDEFRVTGTLDTNTGSGGTGASPGPLGDAAQQMLSTADLKITLTFPGPVTSSNGQVDGNTVTWTPKLGASTELQATASAIPGGGGFPTAALVLGFFVIAALMVAGIVLVRRSKRAGTSPDADVEEEGASAREAGGVGAAGPETAGEDPQARPDPPSSDPPSSGPPSP
jgi:hypothetical protein